MLRRVLSRLRPQPDGGSGSGPDNGSERRASRLPLQAMALLALSAGFGVYGFDQIGGQPEHPIVFDVEDVLPYGITQELVDTVAREEAANTYEPFTLRVVERPLTEEEIAGDFEGADVLLSVGGDQTSSHRYDGETTVSFAGEGGGYAAEDVRSAFSQNLTLGHGPSAVVGAGLTAAELHDDGVRSPALWISAAALPMLLGVLSLMSWQTARHRERRRLDRFSEAKLQLARVVLELDALEVRFILAREALTVQSEQARQDRERLEEQWSSLRRDSLRLARMEQRIAPTFLRRYEYERGWGHVLEELDRFVEEAEELQRRADALADLAELSAGHAGSQNVLERLATPLIPALDDVMEENRGWAQAAALAPLRGTLLALVQEAGSVEPDTAAHQELLRRWAAAEREIHRHADHLASSLTRRLPGAGEDRGGPELEEAAAERVGRRVRAATAGSSGSQQELRLALGLTDRQQDSALHALERALAAREQNLNGAAQLVHGEQERPRRFLRPVALGVGLALASGLAAGGWAASGVEETPVWEMRPEGDQPLAELRVIGDTSALPHPERVRTPTGEEVSADVDDTLTLQWVREHMEHRAESSDLRALLPQRLEATVIVRDLADYTEYRDHPDEEEGEGRLMMDYEQMLEVYRQLKEEAAEEVPELLDPETGELNRDQVLVPLWVLEDGGYVVTHGMTGAYAAGPETELGAYWFSVSEPWVRADGPYVQPVGEEIGFELGSLGAQMETTHREVHGASPTAVFWLTTVTVWTGVVVAGLLILVLRDALHSRAGTREARRTLAILRRRMDELALGLDLARIDLVAVLGGAEAPGTAEARGAAGGAAEEAEQRLHEAGLAMAWRQADALERLPRNEQRGSRWTSRVEDLDRMVETLASRREEISARAERLLRLQRTGR